MTPEDKTKLAKVLNLTQSTVDGEALAAIRMGNTLLKKYNTDWVGFINSSGSINSFMGTFGSVASSYKQGREQGFKDGYNAGLNTGKNLGYKDGFQAGEIKGYKEGYKIGHSFGYTNAKAEFGKKPVDSEPQEMLKFIFDNAGKKHWDEFCDDLIYYYVNCGGSLDK